MTTTQTLSPRYICPHCRASFAEPSKFCGDCGSRMAASPLEAARTAVLKPEGGNRATGAKHPRAQTLGERRLSDSNRAWLGKIVDGRYRVLEAIGRGGVGVIYKVEHIRMGKVAAMKVLHRDLLADPDMAQRFEREATAVSKLHHPHTVQVFDFGSVDGSTFLIMEYVRGLDLGFIIERDGPMSFGRAVPLLMQICGALSEAHELGIVHRDLKPENVLVTRTTGGRDFAKVLDFGLAKLETAKDPTALSMTDRATIVGTPYFMSPEQIRGDHDVNARADIYSFGAMMFNLFTGQQLFMASSAVGVLTKHLTEPPDLPSARRPDLNIDPGIDEIVTRCLYKEPDQRWQTVAELSAALEALLAQRGADAARDSHRESSGRLPLTSDDDEHESAARLQRGDLNDFEASLRRRRLISMTVVAAVLVGGAGAAVFVATRPSAPVTIERESNDELSNANLIASGSPVVGYIGKRRTRTDSDRDVYRLQLTTSESHVVTAKVTGLPNINVALSIIGPDGKTVAFADESGVGVGEALFRRRVRGAVYIAVEQGRDAGTAAAIVPQENVSDTYTLDVVEELADQLGVETEPNGTAADANELSAGVALSGHLESRADEDMLRWTGSAGTMNVTMQTELTTLRWQVGHGEWYQGNAEVALQPGDVVRLQRSDRDSAAPDPKAATLMWTIKVAPK
jgi:eukaryotic-like serine/threonine-protein kinase